MAPRFVPAPRSHGPGTPPRRPMGDFFALTERQRQARSEASAVFQQIRDVALRMTMARDTVVAAGGLTTARVILLERIALVEPRLCTVSEHARGLRLARQSVQRLVNVLARYDLIAFRRNPRHRRARLIALTDGGRRYLKLAAAFEADWLADVTGRCEKRAVEHACWILRALRERAGRPQPDYQG